MLEMRKRILFYPNTCIRNKENLNPFLSYRNKVNVNSFLHLKWSSFFLTQGQKKNFNPFFIFKSEVRKI